MFDMYKYIKPAFMAMDGEVAHNLAIKALEVGVVPMPPLYEDPVLETEVMGLKFPNPVGLAAGFDKNAQVIGPAFKMGFGFVEAGTVTPKPQEGNPKPRVFREPAHSAVINRMGFPNAGATVFKENVSKFLGAADRPHGVLGINIGMNKDQSDPAVDYKRLVKMLGPMADYITVNISSPNTPGLRDLQAPKHMRALLSDILEARGKACGAHPPRSA